MSRTSRTDEAAERCRLHERGPLSLEAARDGAFCRRLLCSREREFATKTCPKRRFWPPYAKVNTLRISKSRRLKLYFSLCAITHNPPAYMRCKFIIHRQSFHFIHTSYLPQKAPINGLRNRIAGSAGRAPPPTRNSGGLAENRLL